MNALQEKVLSRTLRIPMIDCWIHTGPANSTGHVPVWVGTTHKGAHRIMNDTPDGMSTHHLCENPRCVNPAHLITCTQGENSLMPDGAGGLKLAKTHCPQGHPYSGDNLYLESSMNNARRCRTCKLEAQARYRARKRAGLV